MFCLKIVTGESLNLKHQQALMVVCRYHSTLFSFPQIFASATFIILIPLKKLPLAIF